MGVIGKVLKIFSILMILLLLVAGIFGFFIIKDALNFKENSNKMPNLFLLSENKRLLAGAVVNPRFDAGFQEVKMSDLLAYQVSLNIGDYRSVLNGNYKLFIINIKSFENLSEDSLPSAMLSKANSLNILRSANAKEFLLNTSLEELPIPPEYKEFAKEEAKKKLPSEERIRSILFMALMGASQQNDKLFIAKMIRSENIEVYPETALFKFLKLAPEPLINMIDIKMKGVQIEEGLI